MASYNDERNWDQEELDRARELARENVVSDDATVPKASKLNEQLRQEKEGDAQPSEVLEGERFTTAKERELVESGATTNDEDVEAARNAGAKNFERNREKEDVAEGSSSTEESK